jgi:hypothetical protein
MAGAVCIDITRPSLNREAYVALGPSVEGYVLRELADRVRVLVARLPKHTSETRGYILDDR